MNSKKIFEILESHTILFNMSKLENEIIGFGTYLVEVGSSLHDEVLGHDYLVEEDLQQVLGPRFIQKKLPMLRELNFHREIFGLTWKEGIKPDFTFFADKDSKVSQPFVVEFKHTAKLTDDHRKELLQQLKFGQNTFLNKNDELNYGFLWNIVKHKFQISNEFIREISVATLDDLTRELQKVNEFSEKEKKIKFLGDLFITILKDSPKIFSLKKFAGEVDTCLKDQDLTLGEVLSNFEPSYKEVFNNSLKEGSLFKLNVESDPKVELELWKITEVEQNLSMELIKSY